MAMLIGSRLGQHTLRYSAASPDALLPSLFGQIPKIERLNRTSGDAARLLESAERHLAYMAIPYILSVHGAFLVDAAKMVRAAGRDEPDGEYAFQYEQHLSKLDLLVAHEYIAERCGMPFHTDLLSLFHLSRKLRNRIVHYGGASGRLRSEYVALTPDARGSWQELASRPLPEAIVDNRLSLGEGEIIAVLAVSHHLAHAVNDILAQTLSRTYWATVAVNDYRTQHPQRFGEQSRRLRRLRGHVDRLYGPLSLTDETLLTAIERQ
jgi:hypothetical protein